MEKEQGLLIFPSYYDAIRHLPDADRLQIYDAICAYGFQDAEPELDGAAYSVFSLIRPIIDSTQRRYKARQENGKKGGNPAFQKGKPNPYYPKDNLNDNLTDNRVDKLYKDKDKDKDIDRDRVKGKGKAPALSLDQYGQYGWVKLSKEQYGNLVKELGERETKRCIDYVDESAQATGNKNKWKDWNLVVRKCHRQKWGLGEKLAITPEAIPSEEPEIIDGYLVCGGKRMWEV